MLDGIINALVRSSIRVVRTDECVRHIQDVILDCADEPSEKTGKPYAKQTLIEIRNVAKQIIQLAIENRVLDYNCASAVKIPKTAEKSTRRALTEEEQSWITDTPHRAQTAAMIMMYAGLRRGELLALTWQDIDLDRKAVLDTSYHSALAQTHFHHFDVPCRGRCFDSKRTSGTR